jgi:DNA-binding transcriptional regulator YbjK
VRELDSLILVALDHFGDATSGQVAAWIAASTDDVTEALSRLLEAGHVAILPLSRTYARA